MPTIGFVDYGRVVDKVFVGVGEGDYAEDVHDKGDPSRWGGEALEGVVRRDGRHRGMILKDLFRKRRKKSMLRRKRCSLL